MEYFETNDGETILLALVGKDPFPNGATAIPFCKTDWVTQLQRNCSGRHVLLSLGVDIEDARKRYAVPEELFMALREAGVVFLNASYEIIGRSITRRNDLGKLTVANERNLLFLSKAQTVILCGQAHRIRWLAGMERMGISVVHPDGRCRISRFQRVRDEWRHYWSPNAISTLSHVYFSEPISIAE